jgi:hypothetical protein
MASIIPNDNSSHSGSILTKLLHEITGQSLKQRQQVVTMHVCYTHTHTHSGSELSNLGSLNDCEIIHPTKPCPHPSTETCIERTHQLHKGNTHPTTALVSTIVHSAITYSTRYNSCQAILYYNMGIASCSCI